jgi:hypothetical protein
VLPEDDGDVEDREIAWLEYMLKNEKGEEDGLEDGLDGESGGSCVGLDEADGRHPRLY